MSEGMNWEKLLNPNRLGHRSSKSEKGRSPFTSDQDKVLFSGSFRRLARKTQVHPLATNDHVHNRLTHSLEVASVGRTLAIRVGQSLHERGRLPEGFAPTDISDILQAVCLAHDIGNPPFGHTGEEAIRHWFQHEEALPYLSGLNPNEICDLETFEGNAQGFRVLTSSEFHPYDGGLRLTYASLASFLKYPWTSVQAVSGSRPKKSKYGVFQSELDTFREVAEEVGLLRRPGDDWYCRHPLVHLMEIADDFCYGLLDLEDGMDMGILKWEEVFEVLRPILDQTKVDVLAKDLESVRPGRRPPLIRGKVISAFIEEASSAFINNEDKILAGQYDELLPLCSSTVQTCVATAKSLAKTRVFTHPRKIELEIGAYNTIATLLRVMCHATNELLSADRPSSFKSSRVLDLIGRNTFHPKLGTPECPNSPRYLALMRVLDFVSGMTDNYATHLAMQFSGKGAVR
ncbi:deoxyguanosinetriphosphate triphosphohydrolase [Azoarcus sp. DD4]|uniref:deoxyguanosinetriphosphate triphosphohydrolase n=1 Tax=Azoarcus sp. DD4 TaxID=2027405 RepID=UPI00197AD551|nr:deoxyguanosinetriphosphate triphosphohydrolase [Azoarcus sp. DD4]